MNKRKLSNQLQDLVNKSFYRNKHIHNLLLKITSGDGSISWSGAAGHIDTDKEQPVLTDTPFLIASITKMYTAAVIMMLTERGRIDLDQKISEYFSERFIQGLHHYKGKDYTDLLTIRHLISQTSGLPDYFLDKPQKGKSVFDQILSDGDRAWELEDVIELTRQNFQAKFPPPDLTNTNQQNSKGIKAHYSDTNYKLLGTIIESVTQKSLHQVFNEFILEPLSLSNTYLYGQPSDNQDQKTAPVYYKDDPMTIDKLMSSHGPEGGIVSTLDDTVRFGKAFMTDELFSNADTLKSMKNWNKMFFPLQYGYGIMRFKMPWLLSPLGYNPELIGHSGSSGSFLYYCSDLDLYFCGTINQMTLRNTPFQLMIKVSRLVKKQLA
ncbi:MAG: serine hydrolase domain-containing protein [Bacteroidota bacterium]